MSDRRSFIRGTLGATAALGVAQGLTACGGGGMSEVMAATAPNPLGAQLRQLTASSVWTKVGETRLAGNAYHPQGLVRIGNAYYVSTVEILSLPTALNLAADGYDRTTGTGRGHILKYDMAGTLLADLPIGEGTVYHPGGMDFDGTNLWVPAAEYRPDSQALLYRVDPVAMRATKVFGFKDHIGGLSRNPDTNALHGISWGSRRFYRFGLDAAQASSPDALVPPATLRKPNHAFYIDYQDNQYIGSNEMVYTGLTSFAATANSNAFALGGLEIVNLETGLSVHQVPIKLYAASRRPMTTNATWFESIATGIRGYFVPDDDTASVHIYEVTL
ncbi:hypothetical protein GN316_19435 [Xylophilus sp. Kf1]|nr:hypothetical protein [Xylophilus sp. Kf1]